MHNCIVNYSLLISVFLYHTEIGEQAPYIFTERGETAVVVGLLRQSEASPEMHIEEARTFALLLSFISHESHLISSSHSVTNS